MNECVKSKQKTCCILNTALEAAAGDVFIFNCKIRGNFTYLIHCTKIHLPLRSFPRQRNLSPPQSDLQASWQAREGLVSLSVPFSVMFTCQVSKVGWAAPGGMTA